MAIWTWETYLCVIFCGGGAEVREGFLEEEKEEEEQEKLLRLSGQAWSLEGIREPPCPQQH